jgi:hypothetical protein
MTELTQDELTVLLIAREGEPIMPIGKWEAPVKALLARGYLKSHKHDGDPTGYFNNYITKEGKAAADAAEDDGLRAVVQVNNDRKAALMPDWPPQVSAVGILDGERRHGSTGQLFEAQSGQWVRVNPT